MFPGMEDAEVVKEGIARYADEVDYTVRIIKWHTLYGSGDFEDPPEIANDTAVECYYVWFEDLVHKGKFTTCNGGFLHLDEAVEHVENLIKGDIWWLP